MYTMAMYDWTNSEAVRYNGIIQSVQAGSSLLMNILFTIKLADYISNGKERVTSMIGLMIGLTYHLVTFAWPFLPKKVDYTVDRKFYPKNWSKNVYRFHEYFYRANRLLQTKIRVVLVYASCTALVICWCDCLTFRLIVSRYFCTDKYLIQQDSW